MSKKTVTPVQVISLIKQAATVSVATQAVEAILDAKIVKFNELAEKVYPMINDMHVLGQHVSSSNIFVPALEAVETFDPDAALFAAVVRLAPNKHEMKAPLYFAAAPFMFAKSGKFYHVGEYADPIATIKSADFLRVMVEGKANPLYKSTAVQGAESVRWSVEPISKTPAVPKRILATLGDNEPRFKTAEMLTLWHAEQEAPASNGETGLDLSAILANVGLGA